MRCYKCYVAMEPTILKGYFPMGMYRISNWLYHRCPKCGSYAYSEAAFYILHNPNPWIGDPTAIEYEDFMDKVMCGEI